MPRIPVYDTPQVQQQQVQIPQMDGRAPRGAFGEGLAAGLENVGATLAELAIRKQHEQNVTAVEDSVNKLQQSQMELTTWARGIEGKNALDASAYSDSPSASGQPQTLTDVAMQRFDKNIESISGELGNDKQKEMFRQTAARLRLAFAGQITDHVIEQDKKYKADVYQNTRVTTLQDVGQNGYVNGKLDEPYVIQGLQRTNAAIDTIAAQMGWSPEKVKAEKLQAGAQIYGTIIDQMMLNRNVEAAKTYFSVHEKEMDPAMVQQLKAKIADTSLSIKAQDDVTKVFDPRDTLESMEARLQDMYKGNPDGFKEARTELEHRFQVHTATEKAAQQEAIGKLWDMRFPSKNGQQRLGLDKIKLTPEWAALDGDTRNTLIGQWEAFGRRNMSDPATQEAMAAAKFKAYWQYASNPEALSKMTDAQIFALTGQMGLGGVQSLLQMKQQLQMPGKVIASNIDANTIETLARQNGVIPADAVVKSDDENSIILGRLKYKMDRDIEIAQQGLKRELTREEKEKIFKQNIVQYQIDLGERSRANPARWFGDVHETTTKRVWEMTDAEKQNIFVPADARAIILKEASDNGQPNPSEEKIRARYILMKQAEAYSPTTVRPIAPTVKIPKVARK